MQGADPGPAGLLADSRPGPAREFSWDLVAIALVYAVQGLLGLSRLATAFYFKDELHIQPSEVALLTGLAMSPWVAKPVYGFLSDAVPLFGYRRRSYLMLCGIVGAGSWLAMAGGVHSVEGAVVALFFGALSTACSDVVVDSIVVERSRGEPQSTAGSLQSLCWAFQSLGGIASAYFSGWAVGVYGTHPVFAATAVFPLLVSASAFLIDEKRQLPGAPAYASLAAGGHGAPGSGAGGNLVPNGLVEGAAGLGRRLQEQGVALWGAVSQKEILLPAAFVFLWQATPSAESAMFYFYTERLHFTPEFLGRVTLASKVASLAGVGLYNYALKAVPLRRMFLWSALLGTGLGLTQLILITGLNQQWGLSNELFVVGDSVVLVVLGQVSFMPVLVLAARMCPKGVEATLFATLMSLMNAGGFTSSALGAGLTSALGVTASNFDNLAMLVAICNLSSLLPLPLLRLVPGQLDEDEEESKAKQLD